MRYISAADWRDIVAPAFEFVDPAVLRDRPRRQEHEPIRPRLAHAGRKPRAARSGRRQQRAAGGVGDAFEKIARLARHKHDIAHDTGGGAGNERGKRGGDRPLLAIGRDDDA